MGYVFPFSTSTITGNFGETGGGRLNPHRGTDFAPGGPPVGAVEAGVVVRSEYQSGLGNVVVVQHPGPVYSGYSHLASRSVSVGQTVSQGTTLGVVGNTGTLSFGRHLHFTISRVSNNPSSGGVEDPVAFIRANGGSSSGGAGNANSKFTAAGLAALQEFAQRHGYTGPMDGVPGEATWASVQAGLKTFGVYDGPWDGDPGTATYKGIQTLAARGGYSGPIDGDPGTKTSEGFVAFWASVKNPKAPTPAAPAASGLTAEAKRALQVFAARYGYAGPIDGDPGEKSWASAQAGFKTLGLYEGPWDGVPGEATYKAFQTLAARGGYTGPIDGEIGAKSSEGFVKFVAGAAAPAPTTPAPAPQPAVGSFGIDVAKYQSGIDYNAAKAAGVEFVIVKASGLNVSPIYVADGYREHIAAVKAAGLRKGHYYVPGKTASVEAQADFFVANLESFDVNSDVLMLDNEKLDDGALLSDFGAAEFIKRVIAKTGIDPKRVWHYAGASDYRNNKPWTAVEATGARIVWAAYGSYPTTLKPDHTPDLQGSVSKWDVHQFTSKLAVGGKTVDGLYSRLSAAELFAKGTVTTVGGGVTPTPTPTPTPEVPVTPALDLKALKAELAAINAGLIKVIAKL